MATEFSQKIVRPIVFPVAIIAVTGLLIVAFGKSVLAVFQGGTKDRIDRPELWLALGAAIVILLAAGLIVTRPTGAIGILEKPVVFGKTPFFEPSVLTTVGEDARAGEQGTVNDIREGFTLYASSGALATAIGLLPGGSDHGKTFAGYIYAEARRSARAPLWIPFEAVTSVYPESKSAFLSIKGDEAEAFGWNIPPETVRRGPARHPSEL